ncbi:DUF2478 domain-containing protein [Methylocella sp.]|uniref:DUF2478 domain-containing protein n=1 Tax=Methylocella sp. TaxID=1978226 RepID=UPI0037846A7C
MKLEDQGQGETQGETEASTRPLAALVFDDAERANSVVEAFAAELAGRGRRVAGFIQRADMAQSCQCRETEIVNLETGESFPILQDLGRESSACRVDPGALARAAFEVSRALEGAPEILFINRFGKLELEGMGLIAEIGAAAAAGVPTLVCVPQRFLAAWRDFSGGFAEELSCSPSALRGWWRDVSSETAQPGSPP